MIWLQFCPPDGATSIDSHDTHDDPDDPGEPHVPDGHNEYDHHGWTMMSLIP